MPAYGKKLSPAEVDALVDFMATLKPKDTPAVKPSAKPMDKLPRDIARLSLP
jgi:mono/diheme cytochrome c family protein